MTHALMRDFYCELRLVGDGVTLSPPEFNLRLIGRDAAEIIGQIDALEAAFVRVNYAAEIEVLALGLRHKRGMEYLSLEEWSRSK